MAVFLVGAGVPNGQPPQLLQERVSTRCGRRAHERIVHLTHRFARLPRPRERQVEQDRATSRQFRSNDSAGRRDAGDMTFNEPTSDAATPKTVLITGCSSGYGLETARHFHDRGWNVVATMRTPREDVLPQSERLRMLALDVTEAESVAAAVAAAGPIDVLVNNAGVGAVGAFEATPMATAREIFETNTFGVMAVTQAVLPRLRARRAGVVVNVTSSVTLAPHAPGRRLRREQDRHRGLHRVPGARARGGSTCAPSWSSPATGRARASPATGRRACRG